MSNFNINDVSDSILMEVAIEELMRRIKELKAENKRLEEQLMFFLEDWGHCSEMGFCPDLGYLEEDWCPWCKTRKLLGLPIARNWRDQQ